MYFRNFWHSTARFSFIVYHTKLGISKADSHRLANFFRVQHMHSTVIENYWISFILMFFLPFFSSNLHSQKSNDQRYSNFFLYFQVHFAHATFVWYKLANHLLWILCKNAKQHRVIVWNNQLNLICVSP